MLSPLYLIETRASSGRRADGVRVWEHSVVNRPAMFPRPRRLVVLQYANRVCVSAM